MKNHEKHLEAVRSRAKRYAYIRNGITKLITNPFVGILVLLAMVTAISVAWKATSIFAAHLITIPVLVPVFVYALRISTLLIVALLFIGFLYLCGTPCKAQEIENDLAAAFDIKKQNYYRCPFLVACKPIKGATAKEYIFWSRWIDLEKWNKPETKKAVLWAVNTHSSEDFIAGKQKYTVRILVAPGAIPEERETPQDPLFI